MRKQTKNKEIYNKYLTKKIIYIVQNIKFTKVEKFLYYQRTYRRKKMKRKILLLSALLVTATVSYSAEKQSLEASLNMIESKFNDLLEKEAQKKREFEAQKAQLEAEVADLKAKEEGKEKLFEKLKKDSEVRWHRDKYKQILNNYDTYYKNLAKLIREKEQKISELEQILAIMGNQSSKMLKDIEKYFYSFYLIFFA